MNRQNIISAGWMMAIVVMLIGAFHCGATMTQINAGITAGVLQPPGELGISPIWSAVFGVALVACGLALLVMFPLSARHPALGGAILVAGILTALMGVVAVVLVWRNPFSWMMAIVGLALFIDALCLKISLSEYSES